MGDIKKLAIQIIFILLVTILALFYTFHIGFQKWVNSLIFGQKQQVEQTVNRLKIAENIINVEISDEASERSKGLGDVQSIASDSGMLFVFPKKDKYRFWMKGLKFPLDFIWISDGRVVDIVTNVPIPEPRQADNTLPIIQSGQEAEWVLEVNAGYVESRGIKIGDSVTKI